MERRGTEQSTKWVPGRVQRMLPRADGGGGLIRYPGGKVFRPGGEFPVDMASTQYINLQEGYALQQTLEM